ncbi:hypothetical protein V6N12_076153 [Hibiscus sabdariffa]|uniref:Uncharacterized protein n=1 Tax=Hibiscus sabdariffa TaxID=183260 RepID=A0ABR2AUX4_9ROSI
MSLLLISSILRSAFKLSRIPWHRQQDTTQGIPRDEIWTASFCAPIPWWHSFNPRLWTRGTGYEIAGPLEAFNTPIDGKGKELSIKERQWKIVIQERNSKVFIDLRFSSNNWLDF